MTIDTKQELDYYYNLYQARKDLAQVELTYSDMFEIENTVVDNAIVEPINMTIFDERITQETLDTMLATYLAIKNNIIYPNVFLITEPIGFGNRYHMQTINNQIYGHELDFQDIKFKVNFGIKYNAYEGFNLLMNMLADNKAIIEYDWGKGSRYADVRLKEAPKTEKDTFSLIVSKFSFALLNPFYFIKDLEAGVAFENTNEKPLYPLIKINIINQYQSIYLKQGTDYVQSIFFTFASSTDYPEMAILDCENKTITDENGNNIYDDLDKTSDTFLEIKKGKNYTIESSVGTFESIEVKQWVVD